MLAGTPAEAGADALCASRRLTPPSAGLPGVGCPCSKVLEAGSITHPFILRWMDLLCFLLSGAPASGTLAAEIGAEPAPRGLPRLLASGAGSPGRRAARRRWV